MPNLKLDQFQEKWIPIEKEIDRIRKMKVLPLKIGETEWTDDSLRQTIRKLKDDKFTISVCGAVKAGKSTFLNSLLFGQEILPAFDTPLTAKLTFIEYTEKKNYFEASFYSKQEWNDYQNALSPQAKQDLLQRMERSSQRGVHYQQAIGSVPRISQDLSELEMYVSDPMSCEAAKYTPYVKNIHIYINDESIRNIRVVDTPGLNDSNIINSNETCKWIKNTHAMIFLLKSKGADASDIEFFDQNLSQASPESRIFVINKIDSLSGNIDTETRKVIAHLREMGRSKDYADRNGLFGPQEVICRYSALFAMLKNMQDNGYPLDEDQRERLSIPRFRDLDPDPDNIRGEIQKRLYDNAGKIRIGSGIKTILEIYEQKIRNLKSEIVLSQAICEDCDKSLEELQKEITAFTEIKNKFIELDQTVRKHVGTSFSDLMEQNRNVLETGLNHLKAISANSCRSASEMKLLPYKFNYILESEIKGTTSRFGRSIRNIPNDIFGIMQEATTMVKREYVKHGITDPVVFDQAEFKFPTPSLDNIGDSLVTELDNALPSNAFTELFYRNSTMRTDTDIALTKAYTNVLHQFDQAFKEFGDAVDEFIKNEMTKLTSVNDDRLMSKKKQIEANQSDRKEEKEKNEALIEELTKEIEKLDEQKRSFKLNNTI